MRFEDFVLQFDASSRGGFRARVLKSPFGEGTVGFSLPSIAGAEPALPGAAGTSRDIGHQGAITSTQGARPPLEIGTELFRSVFQGQVRTLLDKSRGQLEISPHLGLRLKIKLDPSDDETGALADLPWELLCEGETEDFFALSRQMSLVRYLDVPRSSQPIPFTPPLRILAVGASPRTLQPLDLEEEARRLEDLNRSANGVEVRFLAHASAGAVREALSGDTYNVLHFMGHGTFDRASGEGMLAFEGSDGSLDLVSGKAFATKLRDLRSLGVVVLNACNTARAGQGGANPFRGVATALVLGGVPAVVAMQRPISDRAAIGFSTAFYRHLARGDSIDEALTEGRQAIHSARPEDFEWATPVLFLRMPEGNVFVAKPADRPEEMERPVPSPPPVPVAPPTRGPAFSRRGLALKVVAGTAGTLLVIFVLYNKTHGLAGNPNPPAGKPVETQTLSTSENEPKPKLRGDTDSNPKTTETHPASEAMERKVQDLKPRGPATQPASPPAPAPAHSQTAGTAEAVTSTADLSKLSAQVISIERRDEGGLRVNVRFKNAGDRQLSTAIDTRSSLLSDDQNQTYPIVGSDLPAVETDLRLNLAAGESPDHTFDFPAFKVGSKKFYLSLWTQGGDHRIKVTGSPVTLEGPL